MRSSTLVLVLFSTFLLVLSGCGAGEPTTPDQPELTEEQMRQRAQELAQEFLIVDTHIDVPYRMEEKLENIAERTEGGDFDYPRARQGGLNAPFMSIYVPASHQDGRAKALADRLIDMVEGFEKDWPDKFAVAHSVADVRNQFEKGVISLPMGMENGAPIEGKLENLVHFFDRGIRYITLTHSRVNHICDSSYDSERKWGGLSPFGKEVVSEMNRLGIMVDISHVSDDTFEQVIELTRAPVIASHSSCRHFTPGWERNMSDEMIQKLADNGGVIQIAWGSAFLDEDYRQQSSRAREEIQAHLREKGWARNDPEARDYIAEYRSANPLPVVTVSKVADHIDHVVQLAGVDHVGFGSDFDGVGDSLPEGIKDVSEYPNLILELLKRGYSENDIRKICGENLLRVWAQVEATAKRLQESE